MKMLKTPITNCLIHTRLQSLLLACVVGSTAIITISGCSDSASSSQSSATSSKTPSPTTYTPKIGDILFQSSYHSPLVDMIEGVSESHYSHCGIVGKQDGEWVVFEASSTVKPTPLKTFLERGRDEGYAVYRFKEAYTQHIPEIMEHTETFVGRPYDFRYRLDDEHIYCSELIYKAFKQTTGEELGKLARLGDMPWQPYEQFIKQLENGPVPEDRMMITPIDLALAKQLEPVYSQGFIVTRGSSE